MDEQRQVVAQWKRKTQKVNGELNDTKLLLEEQTSRNVLLEKKQRKFDAEIGLLQEDKKQEMTAREKLQRELDALKAQKYGLEEQIHVSIISSSTTGYLWTWVLITASLSTVALMLLKLLLSPRQVSESSMNGSSLDRS